MKTFRRRILRRVKKYFRIKDDGKVIASYAEFYTPYDEVAKKCGVNTRMVYADLGVYLADWLEKEFTATATCDAVDEYDVRIGKSVAGAKVDAKFHYAMMRDFDSVLKKLDKCREEIAQLRDSHKKKAENTLASIEKYTGGGENV